MAYQDTFAPQLEKFLDYMRGENKLLEDKVRRVRGQQMAVSLAGNVNSATNKKDLAKAMREGYTTALGNDNPEALSYLNAISGIRNDEIALAEKESSDKLSMDSYLQGREDLKVWNNGKETALGDVVNEFKQQGYNPDAIIPAIKNLRSVENPQYKFLQKNGTANAIKSVDTANGVKINTTYSIGKKSNGDFYLENGKTKGYQPGEDDEMNDQLAADMTRYDERRRDEALQQANIRSNHAIAASNHELANATKEYTRRAKIASAGYEALKQRVETGNKQFHDTIGSVYQNMVANGKIEDQGTAKALGEMINNPNATYTQKHKMITILANKGLNAKTAGQLYYDLDVINHDLNNYDLKSRYVAAGGDLVNFDNIYNEVNRKYGEYVSKTHPKMDAKDLDDLLFDNLSNEEKLKNMAPYLSW